MANVTFAGFREFLERSESDKARKGKSQDDRDAPMDYLGGLQFQINAPNSRVVRDALRKDPQIMSGWNWDNVSSLKGDEKPIDSDSAVYVPVKVEPGLKAGTVKTVPHVPQTAAFGKGAKEKKKNFRKRGVTNRQQIVDLLSAGWTPAVQAAAGGGGAPGGAAPPPGGGL